MDTILHSANDGNSADMRNDYDSAFCERREFWILHSANDKFCILRTTKGILHSAFRGN